MYNNQAGDGGVGDRSCVARPDDVSLVILLIASSRRRFSALHNASIGTQIPRVSLEIPRFPFRLMIKSRRR